MAQTSSVPELFLRFCPSGSSRLLRTAAVFVLGLCSVSLAVAQSDTELRKYQDVVKQFQNGDLLALENYVSAAPQGYLRTNGTELLIWEYRKIGDASRAQKWASELLSVQNDNALALATLANNRNQSLTETSPGEKGADESLSMGKRALRGLEQLKPIEGMPVEAFYDLKSQLERSLTGSIGYAYFQRNDYLTAREYLRRSVSVTPNNAQFVYALAIADLYGNPPDKAEGYQMLARSVNLARATPAGDELERFARENFKGAGGSDEDWDAYLANTRIPPTPAPVAAAPTVEAKVSTPASRQAGGTAGVAVNSTAQPSQSVSAQPSATQVATATNPPSANNGTPTSSSVATIPVSGTQRSTSAPVDIARSSPAPAAASGNTSSVAPSAAATQSPAAPAAPANIQKQQTAPVEMAKSSPPPDVAPPRAIAPRPTRKLVPAGAPISIGILIETSAASKESRHAVVNSLADLVRHLRQQDEAFIVSFSHEVVFEQDLTDNAQVLEKAMDSIKPVSGTALFDAVAFASGHLKRVSRNQKRALIVISDGSNHTNHISPLELSGELNVSGVEVYCIGLGADTAADQSRLRNLADRTGGRTILTTDPGQFRQATQEVAQSLGLAFP